MTNTSRTPGWRLATVGGAPVVLTWPWAMMAVVLVAMLYPQYQAAAAGRGAGLALGLAVVSVAALFVSVMFHELAHGLTGRAFGQRPTEYVLTFWGAHTSFGAGATKPGAEAAVAAAGPAANAVLGGIAWAIWRMDLNWMTGAVVYYLMFANLFLAIFNALPAAPLDGGAVLQAFVWKLTGNRVTALAVAGWTGLVVAAGVAIWTAYADYVQGLGFDRLIWPLVIAGLVAQGAWAAVHQARAVKTAQDFDVAKLARPAIGLGISTKLDQAANALATAADGAWIVAVDAHGHTTGYVDPRQLYLVPTQTWGETPLDAIMTALPQGAGVAAQTRGLAGLQALAGAAGQVPALPVVDHERVVGILEMARVRAVLTGKA